MTLVNNLPLLKAIRGLADNPDNIEMFARNLQDPLTVKCFGYIAENIDIPYAEFEIIGN
jgi:hypothetical protein